MTSEMQSRAEKLTTYCQDQLGESLRAVGFHTAAGSEIVYVRDDLVPKYSSDDIDHFIAASQDISNAIQTLDKRMGAPEASLHVLEEGLAIQFHHPDERVTFVAVDQGVGQNFTSFVSDCQDQMR